MSSTTADTSQTKTFATLQNAIDSSDVVADLYAAAAAGASSPSSSVEVPDVTAESVAIYVPAGDDFVYFDPSVSIKSEISISKIALHRNSRVFSFSSRVGYGSEDSVKFEMKPIVEPSPRPPPQPPRPPKQQGKDTLKRVKEIGRRAVSLKCEWDECRATFDGADVSVDANVSAFESHVGGHIDEASAFVAEMFRHC